MSKRTRTCTFVTAGLTGLVLAGCSGTSARAPEASSGAAAEASPYTSAIERSSLRERAIEVLNQYVYADVPQYRANAMEGLLRVPNRAEPVIQALLADENPGVRFVAAMAVGELTLQSAVPAVRTLVRDSNSMVQAAAIYALIRNQQEVDPTPVGDLLMYGSLRERAQAAFVIGRIGDPSARALLHEAAERLNEQPLEGQEKLAERLVRLQIAEALVRLGEPDSLAILRAALYPGSVDELEGSVLAAQMLGQVGDDTTVRELIEIVEFTTPGSSRSQDPRQWDFVYPKELRIAAATSLAKLGYPGGQYVAEMYLNDPDWRVRSQVAFLLGAIGGPSNLSRLERLLADEEILVRIAAGAGLLEALDPANPPAAIRGR